MSEKAILMYKNTRVELPVIIGTEGEEAIDISQPARMTGLITSIPALATPAAAAARSPSSTARRASCATAESRSSSSHDKPDFIEVAWLLIFGRLPEKAELDSFSADADRQRASRRSDEAPLRGLPASTPRPMAILSAMINALSCFHPEFFSAWKSDASIEEAAARPDQQGPHHRRLFLPPFQGPALHLSRPESALLRQLPAHDVLAALPAVRGQPGDRGRPEPDPHPARRSRAELLAPPPCAWSARARRTSSPRCAAGVCALWGPLHGGANVGGDRDARADPPRRHDARQSASGWPRTRTASSG